MPQQNSECGKIYRTNGLASSKNKFQEKNCLLAFPLPIHDNKEQKLHMHLPSDSAISLLRIYSEDTPLKVHKYTHKEVSPCSTVCNRKILETTYVPIHNKKRVE